MTTDDPRLSAMRVYSALLGSLVPWLALLAAATLADDRIYVGGTLSVAPLYYGFVGLPSLVAIVAGRSALTRVGVTAAMTAVAVYAGVQMATTDDAQAGLAVLLVPMVAFPLAAVVWVGGAVVRRRRTGGQERTALLGLAVVDEATGGAVPPARAVLRSLVVVVEVAAAASLLVPIAVAELVAVAASGRSVTDRVFRTSVVTGG